MTAITAPAPVGARRPVPWTRLVWVTWRQHRLALAGVTVLLGGLGLYLLIMGLKIRSGYASVTSCHPAGSAACGLTRQPGHQRLLPHRADHDRLLAGGPRARRGVRRRAGAGAGTGDRDVPVRLDTGVRADTLGDRQAGAARRRGHRGGHAACVLLASAVRRALEPDGPKVFALPGIAFPAWTLIAFASARSPGGDPPPAASPTTGRGPRVHRPERQAGGPADDPQRGGARTGIGAELEEPRARRRRPTSLPTTTRSGGSTSRRPGTGTSSSSRAAGCSRCP